MECPFELPIRLKDGGSGDRELKDKLNQSICRIWLKVDADYIVQAINSHEKLVKQKENLTLQLLAIDQYCRVNDIDIEEALREAGES